MNLVFSMSTLCSSLLRLRSTHPPTCQSSVTLPLALCAQPTSAFPWCLRNSSCGHSLTLACSLSPALKTYSLHSINSPRFRNSLQSSSWAPKHPNTHFYRSLCHLPSPLHPKQCLASDRKFFMNSH